MTIGPSGRAPAPPRSKTDSGGVDAWWSEGEPPRVDRLLCIHCRSVGRPLAVRWPCCAVPSPALDRPCRVGSSRPGRPGVCSAARPVPDRTRGHPRAHPAHRDDPAARDRGRGHEGPGLRPGLDVHAGGHRRRGRARHRRQAAHPQQQAVDWRAGAEAGHRRGARRHRLPALGQVRGRRSRRDSRGGCGASTGSTR